ncbi:MAG: hypothetical protein ACREDR_23190, partial [Blastocatellia bacterium]
MRNRSGSSQPPSPRWDERAFSDGFDESPRQSLELPVDRWLLGVVLALVVFGLRMVYCASAMLAETHYG